MAIEAIFLGMMSAIAGEVAKTIISGARKNKANEIDIKEFQKSIESAIQQTFKQLENQQDEKHNLNKQKIALLEQSMSVLAVTVNDLNERAGYQPPKQKRNKMIIAPISSLSSEDVFNIANQNTRNVFVKTNRAADQTTSGNSDIDNFKTNRIQNLRERAKRLGMEFFIKDTSEETMNKIEAEILKREKDVSIYERDE